MVRLQQTKRTVSKKINHENDVAPRNEWTTCPFTCRSIVASKLSTQDRFLMLDLSEGSEADYSCSWGRCIRTNPRVSWKCLLWRGLWELRILWWANWLASVWEVHTQMNTNLNVSITTGQKWEVGRPCADCHATWGCINQQVFEASRRTMEPLSHSHRRTDHSRSWKLRIAFARCGRRLGIYAVFFIFSNGESIPCARPTGSCFAPQLELVSNAKFVRLFPLVLVAANSLSCVHLTLCPRK